MYAIIKCIKMASIVHRALPHSSYVKHPLTLQKSISYFSESMILKRVTLLSFKRTFSSY